MSTSPTLYSPGKPALKAWGGSKSTLGNRKRAVATRLEVQAAEKATQPTGSVHFMKLRRLTGPSGSAGFFSSDALMPGPTVLDLGVGFTVGAGPPGVIGVMGG